MDREITKKLIEWRSGADRTPLVLTGARQVGKTYSLKEFGRAFARTHYLNFEEDPRWGVVFSGSLDPQRIVDDLALLLGEPITAGQDLLIFDEIQQCPKALTSLKYFSERRPEQALCAAGSLLGVTLNEESFPVGRVQTLFLGPMTFSEFLLALDDQPAHRALSELQECRAKSAAVHDHLWRHLKDYYVTGGLPRVVSAFARARNDRLASFSEVRALQSDLLRGFASDFAKHAGAVNAVHLNTVFENVPSQLARTQDGSTRKYRFQGVVPNKKGFADLRGPIDWLVKAGLILRAKIANRAEVPLEAFSQENRFKLYLFDVGLLGCALRLPPALLLSQDYGMIKGYFAENLVAQGLHHDHDHQPLYSWSQGQAEIEFVMTLGRKLLPIEVKSSRRSNTKSLKSFAQRYGTPHAIKISGERLVLDRQTQRLNAPLYLAWNMRALATKIFDEPL